MELALQDLDNSDSTSTSEEASQNGLSESSELESKDNKDGSTNNTDGNASELEGSTSDKTAQNHVTDEISVH